MGDPAAPDPTRFLPWILTAIVGVVGTLWAALQSGRKAEIARLEAAVNLERAERTRERQEARESLERLGARYDAERAEHARTQRRAARAFLMARRTPGEAESWEAESPTGVHDLLAIASDRMPPRRDPHPELAHWDPTQSTPPGGFEPPRPRIPSRPR